MLNSRDPASEHCGHSHHNVAATFTASPASLRSLSCALLFGVPLPGCRALERLSEVGVASARAELHSGQQEGSRLAHDTRNTGTLKMILPKGERGLLEAKLPWEGAEAWHTEMKENEDQTSGSGKKPAVHRASRSPICPLRLHV